MVDWIEVAPVLRTTLGSMEGAYFASPDDSLLENTFWPTETNNAPPNVCTKMI